MATAIAEPAAENLHQWRRRVKYHRYHMRLLHDVWRPMIDTLSDAAKLLSDRLGDDHDLAILRETLVDEKERFATRDLEAVIGLIDRRRAELQAWSLPLGRRLLADGPKRTTKRIGKYWAASRAEARLAEVMPNASRAIS